MVDMLLEKAVLMKNKHYETGGKPPSNESVVKAIMEFNRQEGRLISNGTERLHTIYLCPKVTNCTKNNAEICFQDGTGWSNPYKHLLACLCSGNVTELEIHYWNALSMRTSASPKAKGKQTNLVFAAKFPLPYQLCNQRERDMFAWVTMIVMEHIPLSSVESEQYRNFTKHATPFSIRSVRNVILAMTLSIEEKLKAEIAAAGNLSIVHDAWSKFGEHYFALFATYIATRTTVVDGVVKEQKGPVISLLSVAPLHTQTTSLMTNDGYLPLLPEEVEMVAATEFTAKVHSDHILHILTEYYDVDMNKVTNQTADSASVNTALAILLGIAHVNCENHLLSNETKLWMTNTTDETISHTTRTYGPGSVLLLIHQLMISLKTNKNRAVLRASTDVTPKIGCPTRWGSNNNMMKAYNEIREAVIVANDDDNSDIVMPPMSNNAFNKAVKNTTEMLADINHVSVSLQERMANLDRCGKLQDVLIQLSDSHRNDITNHWYGNTFGKMYIDPVSSKRPNVSFVSAVKKMQRREGSTLTPEETDAIKNFLPKQTTPSNDHDTAPTTAAALIAQISGGGKRKSY